MSAFAALADPTRRRIVEMLAKGALSAGDIAQRFDISRSAVSQHLKILRDAGLASVSAAGQHRIYELDPGGLVELEDWLDRIGPVWQKRLDALDRERNELRPEQMRRWRPGRADGR